MSAFQVDYAGIRVRLLDFVGRPLVDNIGASRVRMRRGRVRFV
jgi:hypothetical protein